MLMLMTKGRINPCGSNTRFPNLYGDETNPNRRRDDPDWREAILSDASKH